MDPRINESAEWLLRRDLKNVADWFGRRGFAIDAQGIADELWHAWLFGQR
ncbi:MAG: hypothetical protein H0V44_07560 [Planctomycetes bacterium]|nr:hypothetical protein [Planctomycetota bacterium]